MFLALLLAEEEKPSGPGGMVPRAPNWDAIAFAGPLVKWIFGALMALIVLYCIFKAFVAIKNIGGSESTNAAKEGGQALAFALVAIVCIYFFYDLFVALVSSASG